MVRRRISKWLAGAGTTASRFGVGSPTWTSQGSADAPPAEGPPSEALANALRLYQQERYQEACGAVSARGGGRDAGRAGQPAEGAVSPRQEPLPPGLLPVGARGLRRDRRARDAAPLLQRDAPVAGAARVAAPRARGHRPPRGPLPHRAAAAVQQQREPQPVQPAPLPHGPEQVPRRRLRRGHRALPPGAAPVAVLRAGEVLRGHLARQRAALAARASRPSARCSTRSRRASRASRTRTA
jgi:hypothetical protein